MPAVMTTPRSSAGPAVRLHPAWARPVSSISAKSGIRLDKMSDCLAMLLANLEPRCSSLRGRQRDAAPMPAFGYLLARHLVSQSSDVQLLEVKPTHPICQAMSQFDPIVCLGRALQERSSSGGPASMYPASG